MAIIEMAVTSLLASFTGNVCRRDGTARAPAARSALLRQNLEVIRLTARCHLRWKCRYHRQALFK